MPPTNLRASLRAEKSDVDGDVDLLEAWRGGDESAGSSLLRRYVPSVFRMFQSTAADHAQDLTQRTFAACVEGRDRVRSASSFRAYVFGIARRQLLYFLRSKVGRDDRIDPLEASIQDIAQSPSQVAAGRQEQRLLLEALRRIPLDLQLTVELCYWEGMSMVEIGEVLDVPAGTVKSRLSRARALLRTVIADVADDQVAAQSTMDDFDRWASGLRASLGRPDGTEGP